MLMRAPTPPRKSAFERFLCWNQTCRRCGRAAEVVDFHMFPVGQNSSILFNEENMIPTCRKCWHKVREKTNAG